MLSTIRKWIEWSFNPNRSKVYEFNGILHRIFNALGFACFVWFVMFLIGIVLMPLFGLGSLVWLATLIVVPIAFYKGWNETIDTMGLKAQKGQEESKKKLEQIQEDLDRKEAARLDRIDSFRTT